MMTMLLHLIYWFTLFPTRALAWLMRRDPLMLRRHPSRSSFWIPLAPVEEVQHYFQQESPQESIHRAGRPQPVADWVVRILIGMSGWFSTIKPRSAPAGKAQTTDDIPDEIYTLW